MGVLYHMILDFQDGDAAAMLKILLSALLKPLVMLWDLYQTSSSGLSFLWICKLFVDWIPTSLLLCWFKDMYQCHTYVIFIIHYEISSSKRYILIYIKHYFTSPNPRCWQPIIIPVGRLEVSLAPHNAVLNILLPAVLQERGAPTLQIQDWPY